MARFLKWLAGRSAATRWVSVLVILTGTGVAVSAPGSWSGSLDARVGPSSPMGIPLTVGRRELVTVQVTGQIKLGEAPWSGPDGSDYYGFDDDKPPYGYTQGIVIAKIHGCHFPIEGGSRSFDSPHTGQIFLYVNDDVSSDNQGAFSVSVIVDSALVGDADEDGLDDALEDQLLDQYAPYIRFDSNEWVRPSDVYYYLRNAYMTVDRGENDGDILDCTRVPFYPEWFLCQLSVPRDQPLNPATTSTNYLVYHASQVAACVNPRNEIRDGPDWARIAEGCSFGVYGHVAPQGGNTIVLQYSLFYGYNDVDVPFGIADHEGEWELFEVYIDRNGPYTPDAIQKIMWRGHNDNGSANALAAWERGCNCWTWTTSGYFNSRLGDLPQMPPPDGHAPVFVEAGTHGGWPCPVDYDGVGANWGNSSHNYVPSEIPNLGEAYRPRLGCEVVLHFNGRWGAYACCLDYQDTPPGPVMQGGGQPWVWPTSGNDIARYVGLWNHGQSHPHGTAPTGMISWPHHLVGDAIDAASSGQTILIYPGTYGEALTISKPVTLKAPHGSVTIGG